MSASENLPPGCTDRDIELDAGSIRVCFECGQTFEPQDKTEVCLRCQYAEDSREY